jgi:S-adenosylmethionine:tRNA ribosyltransferase-isomerase
VERTSEERILVEFVSSSSRGVATLLAEAGSMPIPPYIRKGQADESDKTDYQTVFAQEEGSIAAPTASLHFTEDLNKRLIERGCHIHYLTMHLGPASFLPLAREGQEEKAPGQERLNFEPEFFLYLKQQKSQGKKVVAVGTSVVRALESMRFFEKQGFKGQVSTDLFIRPGHNFQIVDKVITNFHQPGTTHLMLVEALLGEEMLTRSYNHALGANYRFLSYGDGMLII